MRNILTFAFLLLAAVSVGAQGADVVYVGATGEGAIYAIDTSASPATATLIFQERKFVPGDLVMGPDGNLYVCSPGSGVVFHFDPTVAPAGGLPYSFDTVEVLDTTGVNAPQCGWFSDKGDLFLTDRGSDTAVWIYNDLVPLTGGTTQTLTTLVAADDLFAGFAGQGVTQAAKGDLLFVDQANGAVGTLPFDPIFRFDAPSSSGPGIAYSSLDAPVGIARLGNGTVFIASGDSVISDGYSPCGDFSFEGETPQFLELTADDVLYVTSTAKRTSTLWSIDAASCTGPTRIFTFERPDYSPGLSGVAVPYTTRAAEVPPIGTDPDYLFNFKDHAYELSFVPTGACVPNDVVATEIDPSCLADIINGGYVVDDNNPVPVDSISGNPVPYAGDGGAAQLYTITGSCPDDPPIDKQIFHAISAYTALVGNPRIVRCEFEFAPGEDYCNPPDPCPPGGACGAPAYCELIELESFFPFNGIFPEDGRISGVKSSTTSDFSEYFIADIDLADGSFDATPGCFCGWEDPLSDIDYIDPENPSIGLPSYNPGSSVPLKFRVAALPTGGSCDPQDDSYVDVCNGAPYGYVTGAQVLLSVAKIYDGADVLDFTPLVPTATSATTPGTIFGNPSSPSTPYHYNLDTSGYDPGVYQAVAVALTDNFTVDWTYFAID